METTAFMVQGNATGYKEILTNTPWFTRANFSFDGDKLKAIAVSLTSPEVYPRVLEALTAKCGTPTPSHDQHGPVYKWRIPSGDTLMLQANGVCGLYAASVASSLP